MIARLTILTTLLALFALSFAGLIETTRPSHAAFAAPGAACLDRGLVCPSDEPAGTLAGMLEPFR